MAKKKSNKTEKKQQKHNLKPGQLVAIRVSNELGRKLQIDHPEIEHMYRAGMTAPQISLELKVARSCKDSEIIARIAAMNAVSGGESYKGLIPKSELKEIRIRRSATHKIDPYCNYALKQARADQGLFIWELARDTGIGFNTLYSYETLRTMPPIDSRRKIAEALERTVEELFPDGLDEITRQVYEEREMDKLGAEIHAVEKFQRKLSPWARRRKLEELGSLRNPQAIHTVSESELPPYENGQTEKTYQNRLGKALNEAMGTLKDRERRILELRFGLEDGKEYTLEEVGRTFEVTGERIRQIEGKALRKLQSSDYATRLMAYTES